MNWISLFIAFILTVILTGIVRKFCITFEIVDYPSQRRTHQTVTPRGGGIAIVIVFLSYLLFYQLTTPYYFALLPALLIAFMGLWDDVRSISPHFRLAMQFICAITSVYLIGDFGIAYQIIGIKLPMVLDLILVTLFIVWSTNLYNFMDGVNGLAVIEALCLSLFMGSLALSESQTDWGYLWLILASGAAGFLGWNFPHAKIFLGDIGSHFLVLFLVYYC